MHVALTQLALTFIAMTAEPHPSDSDPWSFLTLNAPLPEPIDGYCLARSIAADSDAVPSCILDSFFL